MRRLEVLGSLYIKKHAANIQELQDVNPIKIFGTLTLNNKTSIKIMEDCAPTSAHSDEEVNNFMTT